MTLQRRALGQQAEELAVRLFESQGFTIAHRNWRRPQGELDIVAVKEGTCVFVEVRSRTGDQQGHALETVTASKRAQVVRCARLFLSEESLPAQEYRFDVVAVTFTEAGEVQDCLHVPAAFDTNE